LSFLLAIPIAVHPSGAERTQKGHIAPFDRKVLVNENTPPVTRPRGRAALTIGFIVIGTGPAQAADQATVSILHGVPGATVDVYVDGKALLKNFKPGTLTDPQMLPTGSYDLKVVKAGRRR
jgi:hypothetical protein